MALTINNNIAAFQVMRSLNRHSEALGRSFSRLSSGLRLHETRVDPAGFAIATRMSSQIRGMNTAVRNLNDGISMTQVADQALDSSIQSLQRIRELAVQAANATYNTVDCLNLSQEKDQLIAEIQRIASDTNYNNISLLNGIRNEPYFLQQGGVDGGSRTSFQTTFQIGADAGQTIVVYMALAHVSALGLGNNGSQTSMLTVQGANQLIDRIDHALDSVTTIRATLGAMQSRFESIIANLSKSLENTTEARSRILDVDMAQETATMIRETILQNAGMAILVQANQQPTMALKLLQ